MLNILNTIQICLIRKKKKKMDEDDKCDDSEYDDTEYDSEDFDWDHYDECRVLVGNIDKIRLKLPKNTMNEKVVWCPKCKQKNTFNDKNYNKNKLCYVCFNKLNRVYNNDEKVVLIRFHKKLFKQYCWVNDLYDIINKYTKNKDFFRLSLLNDFYDIPYMEELDTDEKYKLIYKNQTYSDGLGNVNKLNDDELFSVMNFVRWLWFTYILRDAIFTNIYLKTAGGKKSSTNTHYDYVSTGLVFTINFGSEYTFYWGSNSYRIRRNFAYWCGNEFVEKSHGYSINHDEINCRLIVSWLPTEKNKIFNLVKRWNEKTDENGYITKESSEKRRIQKSIENKKRKKKKKK